MRFIDADKLVAKLKQEADHSTPYSLADIITMLDMTPAVDVSIMIEELSDLHRDLISIEEDVDGTIDEVQTLMHLLRKGVK